MTLTKKRTKILNYLKENSERTCTPTELGQKIAGKSALTASPWACPCLKSLVSEGLVCSWGRGKYQITVAGIEALAGNFPSASDS